MNGFDGRAPQSGSWEENDPHGGVVSGQYLAGAREGLWRHYFRDGSVRSESHYENGELTGECVWYRQGGGLLQKGGFLAGEKHGFWQRWSSDGALLDEGTFAQGKKTGIWTQYSADGSVRKTTTHRGHA